MKLEKDIPNISGSDVVNWIDFIDRDRPGAKKVPGNPVTDISVKTEPPPLDELPAHGSVDLTTENIIYYIYEPENLENEESEPDEIFDTDAPEEVNDLKKINDMFSK